MQALRLIQILFVCLYAIILLACGSATIQTNDRATSKPIQLRVHNNSSNIIDSIDAKPCGSGPEQYKTQMTGIKPQQKIMLEIYMSCVDLVATDGFGTPLAELTQLRLNTNTIWSIR
ncbi:MAG: hypothetical protein OEZ68_01520 [Gammaproteobacteria bacterium]|nr:hypothetical protein [Gammaproteobacteria bacterium]MDH5799458.1 hypothetical protein [Gammaproteobacteria bacterium]